MPKPTHPSLPIVQTLDALSSVPGVAAAVRESRAALATSVDEVIARLASWSADFAAGSASATVKAVRSDWTQYLAWCDTAGHSPLPASVLQLEAFLVDAIDRGRKRATVDRYLYTVGLVHIAAGLPSPSKDPDWAVKWKKLTRRLKTTGGHVRKQAAELDMAGVTAILATLGDSPRDLRDAALLSIASDTLCRESELVAIEMAHLHLNRRRNTWALHVPFSRTNQDGESPDYRFVSHETLARVRAWQGVAGITEGPLFRPIGGRPKLTGDAFPALLPQEVARIFRRRARAAGLEGAAAISGHSARIGSANDLAEHGATSTQIQQAGGWKTERMVSYYTRRSCAGENAMAYLRRAKDLKPTDRSQSDVEPIDR
ncbi:Site-specific recombinase XerD [Luteibacter sp. UNC138MFCol5.1]|uniref:tyrosine-type recombinase/integrase n=1 Tax=Luteibacter sp. UNC138MFCol5.1 TaxID=1502774 RepID=UPI0008D2DBBF|nr:tyrosine-type recombinase/integrase [Luteibacter sp. UNC138MFCol5.1]SEO93843.1 Site-specific recombinase XerD [Luteibacter sp. UNC138MFCol5.1]